MRYVYPTDQVIHLWAHQSQDSARNGSTVHFDGPELYSYSTTIAAIIDGIVYISENNMSASTAKHICMASSATSHMDRFSTCAFSWSGRNPSLTHEAMILPCVKAAEDTLKYALQNTRTRAKTKLAAIVAYNNEKQRIQGHAGRFHVALPVMTEIEAAPDAVKKYEEAAAAATHLREVARIKAQKKQQKEDKKQFDIWLATGAGRCPYSFHERGNDFITIKIVDNNRTDETGAKYEIITSQGARCPLNHAVKALKFYRSRDISDHNTILFTPYHTNGHKIPLGVFTLDSIDEAGTVKAGCHTFTAQEIDRFINQWQEVLGL